MLVHDISSSSKRCLVHAWCTIRACIKFFESYIKLYLNSIMACKFKHANMTMLDGQKQPPEVFYKKKCS